MDLYVLIGNLSEWMGVIAVAWLLSISKRFQLPPIGFVYARRDGLVSLSIYALILIAAFVYYATNPPVFREAAAGGVLLVPAPVTDFVQALIVAGMAVLPVIVAMWVRRQPIRSMGWHQKALWPAALMGLALAFITIFLRNRIWVLLGGVDTQEFFTLLTALGITLAEETVFRGFILMRLAWWLGEWRGMALTSLLYALYHLPPLLGHQPVDTVLLLSTLTFLQGMVLAWIMRKSHHILAPAMYRAVAIWMQVLT